MALTIHPQSGGRALPRDQASTATTLRHLQVVEHLANERTHLAYVCASLTLIAVGVALNRLELLFAPVAHTAASATAAAAWRGTGRFGIGMVAYGLALLLVAFVRYRQVSSAIVRLTYRPGRLIVELVTWSAFAAGAGALVWLWLA